MGKTETVGQRKLRKVIERGEKKGDTRAQIEARIGASRGYLRLLLLGKVKVPGEAFAAALNEYGIKRADFLKVAK